MLCGVDWLAFITAMVIVELTPGPNMGWLTALSAQRGRKVGLMAVAGITLGLCVQLIAAATGFSEVIAGNAAVYQAFRWAGVAFMLFLAWEAYAETGETSPGRADGLEGFRRGFVANVLNPKALVFYLAIVSQFAVCAGHSVAIQILALGAIHIGISIVVHVALVLLGSRLGHSIAVWRQSLLVRTIFALALVGLAIWLAIATM